MNGRFVIALLAVAMLCASTLAQENTANYWYKIGINLTGNRSYEKAVEAYENAIKLSPENATLWDAKASSQSMAAVFSKNRSEYNESLKAEDKAVELSPQNAGSIWYTKAESLNKSGRYDDALKAYDRSIDLKGPMDLAYEGKGEALFKLGKYDDAVKAYDEAMEQFPLEASGPAWYKKGIALKALGKNSEADAAFSKAKDLGYQG